jgi:hypothetical protein
MPHVESVFVEGVFPIGPAGFLIRALALEGVYYGLECVHLAIIKPFEKIVKLQFTGRSPMRVCARQPTARWNQRPPSSWDGGGVCGVGDWSIIDGLTIEAWINDEWNDD